MHPLTIIFSFVLAATIVSFGFALIVQKRHIAYKERKDALDREAQYGSSTVSQNKQLKLEERVQVLERIATDQDHSLALQIEALREVQDVDQLEERI